MYLTQLKKHVYKMKGVVINLLINVYLTIKEDFTIINRSRIHGCSRSRSSLLYIYSHVINLHVRAMLLSIYSTCPILFIQNYTRLIWIRLNLCHFLIHYQHKTNCLFIFHYFILFILPSVWWHLLFSYCICVCVYIYIFFLFGA